MNLSRTLVILLDIFFFLMVLIIAASIAMTIYTIYQTEESFFQELAELDGSGIYYLIHTLVVGSAQFIYLAIIYYFRKGIKGMVEHNFFHMDVSKYLNVAGKLLALVSVVSIFFKFILPLFVGSFSLSMETSLLESEVFIVIIGLFLMLMSRVIKVGLTLKSENELTI